jgi:hypothetical protein
MEFGCSDQSLPSLSKTATCSATGKTLDRLLSWCELRGRKWSIHPRPDAMDFAQVMVDHIVPPYRALMESYDKAQSVQRDGRETKLERLIPAQPSGT